MQTMEPNQSKPKHSTPPPRKYTSQDLKDMQAWPLERKIQVTQTRILEWIQRWGEDHVYVSFSGGKDSTVLLDLARRVLPTIPAVFCDTGLEYPEIRKFVKTFENVTWIRPEKRFDEVIKECGYPIISKEVSHNICAARNGSQYALRTLDGVAADGSYSYYRDRNFAKWKYLMDAPFPISDQCCNEIKKKPFKKYEKEHGQHPIVAIMASESRLRKLSWMNNGCNMFDGKRPISKPMSFWTEQDVLHYILKFNIPLCSIYGDIVTEKGGKHKTTGNIRTGCMFCMFGAHLDKPPNIFQRMQLTHPKQWEYCMKPIEQGGLGLSVPLDYIGCPWKNEKTEVSSPDATSDKC